MTHETISIEEFYQKYQLKIVKLSTGKPFVYRYYQNPHAKATVVLLTGGIGLSDLFYLHFDEFAKDFSVLTFDYQIQFADNREFAEAVAELLHKLHEKVWLVGQSLGGLVAQIIAVHAPDCVAGLVLSNTCSLSADMSQEAYTHAMNMIKSSEKSRNMLAWVPFSLYKKLMRWAVMKKTAGFTEQETAQMRSLCDAMMKLLTKQYECHMLDFLIDVQNHFGMKASDFQLWDDKVLLILSEDDKTFNQPCKDALIQIMTNPTVITDITGGHLALLIRLEQYAQAVREYILQRAD